ncbi:MAG: hypothetical protein JNM07_10635 [Phycisphaerae bacterium]|nr:hypothetical protein [Phycisphaerae bacterium]
MAEPPAPYLAPDMRRADAVIDALRRGRAANLSASCRRGGADVITPPGRLLATGDLHDNPVNFRRVLAHAGLPFDDTPAAADPAHITLHEVIHPDRLVNGMDFSYRSLARVAALKAAFPERVHALLANHELAQMTGSGIIKDDVNVVEAFDAGLDHMFGDDAPAVRVAIGAFVRSMPLALRVKSPNGGPDVLAAHGLPAPIMADRFDPAVLEREPSDLDFEPRKGSAHLMVWGRGWTAEWADHLATRWNVGVFILGHEKAEEGCRVVCPRIVVVNSDHDRATLLDIDLAVPPATAADAATRARALGALDEHRHASARGRASAGPSGW